MEIIKAASRTRTVAYLTSALLLAGAPALLSADLVLHKVPSLTAEQAATYPENLARYDRGAQVEAAPQSRPIANLQLTSENNAEAALLCSDPTVGYALPSGKSTILVSLSGIENVNRIAFLNSGAKGAVTIATSSAKLPADSPQWHAVLEQDLSPTVEANVAFSEAKYVRLTFDVTQPGRIAGFGIYGTPKLSAAATHARKLPVQDKSDSFALISYNLTDVHAKARALYVSSGSDFAQANNMLDDQTATTYSFETSDASPTAIIDLGKPSTLRRLSAVYPARAGKMDFFLLQALPNAAAEGTPETVRLDEAAVANLKSVGSASDDGTRGRASIDFPATAGRYVMVRWTPAAQQDAAFSLAEVAAFSGADRAALVAANVARRTGDGKTMLDGKTMIDTKDMPAEGPAEEAPQSPAEGPPPTLPQPPPFTFVPVLVPVSPD
jgi:hypothetical protein